MLIAAGLIGPTSGAAAVLSSGALSLGLTAASAYGSIMAGQQQAASSRFQAKQSELQARMEGLKGRESALQIRQQLERDLAGANATFAARGLMSEGSAQAALQAGKERATSDIEAAMFGAENAKQAALSQAAQYRSQASSQSTAGIIGAATTVASSRTVNNLLSGGSKKKGSLID
jgi:hypothetical protein